MAAKKKTNGKGVAVIVRAYSGVFFGRVEKQEPGRIVLLGARQVWSWTSDGCAQKINTCPDIAAHGLGVSSKMSEPATRATIEQVGAVFECSAAATKILDAQKWATR